MRRIDDLIIYILIVKLKKLLGSDSNGISLLRYNHNHIILRMQFLRRLRMPKFGFSTSKNINLRPALPFRNGGLKCLPRIEVVEYYKYIISLVPEKPADCTDLTINMIPEVRYFYEAVKRDPILRMCCQGALDEIADKKKLYGSVDFDGCMIKLFDAISTVCITPPRFYPIPLTGVPIYSLFIDFLNTPFGEAFFANPIVN